MSSKNIFKRMLALITMSLALTSLVACSDDSSQADADKVVIYSNADKEAIDAMEKALDNNGFSDKYMIKTFGTSELGGKLMAEGKDIEADMITMSSFYEDSIQKDDKMFLEFTPDVKPLNDDIPNYRYPITVQEGAIFYNSKALEDEKLPVPASFKDLTDPAYEGLISLSDVKQSSTAWLTIQALIDNYGEEEAKEILAGIYKNAGDSIESSGSAPMEKVLVGEVPLAIGLRHQAVLQKQDGKPIEFVDPEEGTYYLTEDLAIIDKGDEEKEESCKKMADIILKEARKDIIKLYPNAVYEGEEDFEDIKAEDVRKYPEELTVDLLKDHQDLSEEAKKLSSN